MQVSRLNAKLLVLLLTLFSITTIARATQEDTDEPDDYEVKDRVVRISLITGEVNLRRRANQDWERARLNYPLVEGDTVATDKDSRMEIQIDARNFVRLAPGSALRITTLRDEGVALSVLEGTVVVRLVKFDRSKEYFEVDAPRTTMAAEKPGLYRVDVPRDGRVRLTVRDGGSARIYSDTSGFSLRDGRSAELVVAGENAGDWEFLAATSDDAFDTFVSDRERFLAQRLRYDSEYYDEYAWGAEELAAYGEWTFTDDFGWIWRPHPGTISAYADWAPYRYGHWTWVQPYGWTWVGYEPWGWAPYHYGRWVFRNNQWAWVPRSQFNRNRRSWWRPALVAFVNLNISIGSGSDICWYPLGYYERDPYSRRYRHQDRDRGRYAGGGRPGGGGNGGGRPPYTHGGGGGGTRPPTTPGGAGGSGGAGQPTARDGGDYRPWRGVTRVPRRDFGNDDEPGRPVEEGTARRVIDSPPELDDLPRRIGPRRDVGREVQLPAGPTGAADRTPGVALDEELRRARVFRGREPRTNNEPSVVPATQAPGTTNQGRPSGAVVRPEAGSGSEERPNRGIERRPTRDAERPGIETRSEPRIDTPQSETPRVEPPRQEPPRTERAPRVESPRPESRPEPRSEAPRSDPPPRRDPPPRADPPRSESRPEPRSEPSRS
ncbi:MAG TPA: DUF6600 domain-containing protein, partial [Pyrinomonadaceae bacterium]|nr:DUF6600 domain-containing protein [Pyrinomonadaceae bacterium]